MNGINSNTYISIGMLISLLIGFGWVINSQYQGKFEIATHQTKIEDKVDQLSARMDKSEKLKETWAFPDMFKWAVKLQRDNPSLKVPDPIEPDK